ncbi:hypothetical protein GCM10023336_24640 [Streptomyces similanensis]|uniref:Uncharacterized protein n=1 Tax=Streptomyces similanensis TaxID=1274988 RepID=A0ABP9K912_9ACTN
MGAAFVLVLGAGHVLTLAEILMTLDPFFDAYVKKLAYRLRAPSRPFAVRPEPRRARAVAGAAQNRGPPCSTP